jgi:hypothetical protein
MSWHYLQGQEAASWEGACLDGAPSALLRLMPTAGTHSSHDSATDASNGSRYGTMSRPSMADRGAVQLTLCLEDSPAKTSARQAHARDWPEDVAASSLKCSGLLARSGLALCGRKTLRTCVPVASAPSSASLPAWGMMRDGECWELGTRVRRTSADECGFWPTPTTAGNELSPYMMRWPAHRRMARAFLPTPTAERYGSNRGGRGGWGGAGATLAGGAGWWDQHPTEGVDDGVANRMDRVRATGNGQVPAVAQLAWRVLSSGY